MKVEGKKIGFGLTGSFCTLERVLRVLLWAASVMAGTLLASWTLGLYSLNLLPALPAARL